MSKTLLPLLNKNEVVDNGICVIMYDIERLGPLNDVQTLGVHSLREHEDFVTVWMFNHVQTRELCFSTSIRLSYTVDFFFFFFFFEKKFHGSINLIVIVRR